MRSHIGNDGLRVGALNDAAEDSKKDARYVIKFSTSSPVIN